MASSGGVSSQERLEALIRNSPLAVIEWDSGHHVISWSGDAPHMFGWEASEVLGKRLDEWRFVHEEDRDLVRTAMDAMESGLPYIGRNRNYRKDGSTIHCEWHNSVLLDRNGAFGGGLSLVLDTTERKSIEEALRASEEKYRKIVETAPIGIYRSTVDGRLLSANSKLAELFHYFSPEAMLASIRSLGGQLYANPEQRSAVVSQAAASPSQEFVQTEVEFRRPDGSAFLGVLYLRAVRDPPGEVLYLCDNVPLAPR